MALDRSDRQELDIHFRVNGAELDQRAQSRKLGSMALSKGMGKRNKNRVSHVGIPLDEDIATDLLSGADVYSGAELAARRHMIETALPLYEECALALVDISKEFGTARLIDLAERIRNNYVADAKKIGLAPADDGSINWALFELAKQYHFARHNDEVWPKDAGIEKGSPFGYGSKHRQKQQELIDQRIGEAFANKLVKVHKLDQPQEVYIRQPDGSYERELKERYVVVKDKKLMLDLKIAPPLNKDGVRPAVKNQLDAILDKITAEDRELSYKDQVEIGQLLRREFAH
jgi:hypothetical protein